MKPLALSYKLAACGVLFLASPRMNAQAQSLLSYWNFNNDNPQYVSTGGTLGSFSTTTAAFGETYTQTSNSAPGTLGSNTGNGAVFSGSNVFIDFSNIATVTGGNGTPTVNGKSGASTPAYTAQATTGGPSGYGVFADSTLNQRAGDTTTGGSLLLLNTTTNGASSGMNGKYLTFDLSSTGYSSLTLTYVARITNAVTASQVWSYSTDGTNYSALTTISPAANGTFLAQSLNLSSLSANALDNQPAFYLRLTYSTPNSGGSQAFDNFQLTGSAVPEPSTWLAGGCMVLFLACHRLRKGWSRRAATV